MPIPITLAKSTLWSWTLILTLGAIPLGAAPHQPSTSQVPAALRAAQKKYGLPPATTLTQGVKGLGELLALQRQSCAWACLTSTFYDYRGLSLYRRQAGLHLGYDIAMEAGSGARVGWPGRVISIAPWAEGEWGVTVLSPDGREVTYGHIVPSVHLGQELQTGQIVGQIAKDHVDVKMRDAQGQYVPFGEDEKELLANGSLRLIPTSSRQQLMVGWLSAANNLEELEEELAARQREARLQKVERQKLEERYTNRRLAMRQMEGYFAQGLISRRDVEKSKQDLEKTRQELKRLKEAQRQSPQELARLQKQLVSARQRQNAAQKRAQAEGIEWAEVQNFINNLVANDRQLKGEVQNYKRRQKEAQIQALLEAKSQVRQCQAVLESQEKIYRLGGLPQRELKATRQKLEILEANLKRLQESQ